MLNSLSYPLYSYPLNCILPFNFKITFDDSINLGCVHGIHQDVLQFFWSAKNEIWILLGIILKLSGVSISIVFYKRQKYIRSFLCKILKENGQERDKRLLDKFETNKSEAYAPISNNLNNHRLNILPFKLVQLLL